MQMQPPSQAPVPPPAAPVPSSAPARGRGPLVTALLAGLLVGGGGVGAAWALSGGSSPEGGTEADARGACSALAGLDESELATEGTAGDQAMRRFAGAYSLSESAAAGDSSYEPLAEAVTRAFNRHRQVFEVDAEVQKKLAEARDICAGL
ncbi:hypothetical protein [Streptomyces poriticola]|uniref:hypothetical protein n=1 Tax=Streptomyces poriticola TaxID=3120506 RepID=UPI002FCE2D3F